MIKIAIGVPVYNQARTIGSTIEALLAQKHPAHDVVVSENHSTDGTREVVESYRDRIRIVRPPAHCEISDNWNFCVTSCAGEWVALCSGDDALLPNYVEDLSAAIAIRPSAVFAMGGWENYYEATGKIQAHYLLSMGALTRQPKALTQQLRGPKASFAAFCFKKEAFLRTGGFDRNFRVMQDWMLQFDLAKQGDFIKINKIVARYRIAERPDLREKRLPLFVADRAYYLETKIWSAVNYGVSASAVNSAAKDVFRETLNLISLHKIALNSSTEAALTSVARRLGMEAIWHRWRLGKWRPSPRYLSLASPKSLVRPILSALLKKKR
jgi:glycosyltransferase involved in cell wall biosynthesis